jgi:tetratricopeptide (TPR) repeat protein
MKPNDLKVIYSRGNAYYAIGDYAMALKDYDRALQLKPNDAVGLYSRGNTFSKLGDFESAIADYDAALRLAPGDVPSLTGRGLAFRRRIAARRRLCAGPSGSRVRA